MGTTEGLRTPLYDFHEQNNAKFVDFAGWRMPIQYGSILEEHKKTREAAGLFDVSHMGEFLIEGDNAHHDVNRLITNDLTQVGSGQAIYSPMCKEDGGVVDDLILYRRSDTSIFICCNAANVSSVEKWFKEQLADSNCLIENQSAQYAQIAVQGPVATEIVNQLHLNPINKLLRFHFVETSILGQSAILSRTGYTGEDGYEIYCAPEHAMDLAEKIHKIGSPKGLIPVGLGARDSLRLEAGYPLFGHEISDQISPIEGGLGWTVKFSKSDNFVGREALQAQKNSSETRKTIHFVTQDKRIAREGAEVFSDGKCVGSVQSGSFSPILNCGIGSALVNGNTETEAGLSVMIRNKSLPIFTHKPPLHKIDLTAN